MALARARPVVLLGRPKPRVAPPTPVKSDVAGFRATAASMGIQLMPWQETAARYLTATNAEGRKLYREVCVVVARQNGKTTLVKPLVVGALRAGRRITHIAQTRDLPRDMFNIIADALSSEPDLFPRRRGKIIWPRYGAGQEEIILANGGTYRIAAANRGGARGRTNDIVIVDELREMADWEVLNAAEPTISTSPDGQLVYLSNAGTEDSVVLNGVRSRAGKDDSLAYLEWSAAPERAVDDREGWREANPALGHIPSLLREIEISHNARRIEGTMAQFETERLCRWVKTMRETLVDLAAWAKCETKVANQAPRTFMGISYDPSGTRASAALAWQKPDGKSFGLRHLLEGTGNPINVDALGRDLKLKARENGVTEVGFDPLTDSVLAKYFSQTKAIAGSKFANASARFVEVVKTGALTWTDCAAVGTDLSWTARKEHDESGSFQAVRADDDRPITAALAAIRAISLASVPRPVPSVRQPQAVGF